MKHCFVIYDMVGIGHAKEDNIIENLKMAFSKFGYMMNEEKKEIEIIFHKSAFFSTLFQSKSAIVISDDSICTLESEYISAKDLWNVPQRIDCIIVDSEKVDIPMQNLRTPTFSMNDLNYMQLVSALIQCNT